MPFKQFIIGINYDFEKHLLICINDTRNYILISFLGISTCFSLLCSELSALLTTLDCSADVQDTPAEYILCLTYLTKINIRLDAMCDK